MLNCSPYIYLMVNKPLRPFNPMIPNIMKRYPLLILLLLPAFASIANDTLYFRLSNPWNTVKSATGEYLRKCVKEKDYFHCWDYNQKNALLVESFYTDTNFTTKLYCHKYYYESKGYLAQTRCYESGKLHGYFVDYNEKGDTVSWKLYNDGNVLKEWPERPNNTDKIFLKVEVESEYPGGRGAWQKHLSENITYPRKLKENIKGVVISRFTVTKDGNVEDIQIIKGLHPLLDAEVIRVIRLSKRWTPAKQNGKPVKSLKTQPVVF